MIDRPTRLTPEECRELLAEPLPQNLGALLDHAAERFGDAPAWVFFERDETLGFRMLRDEVNRAAHALRRLGVGKGTHVAVMSPNRPAFCCGWLALARLGAVIVPLNTRYTGREVHFVLEDSDADHLLIDPTLLPAFEAMEAPLPRLPDDHVVLLGDGPPRYRQRWDDLVAAESAEAVTDTAVGLDDVLNIQYTSGTTGFPKGCLLTHRYWMQSARVMLRTLGFPLRRAIYNQNFFYMDGPLIATLCLFAGAAFYMVSRPSAQRFSEWLKRYAIDYCFFFEPLYKVPEQPGDSDNPLKLVLTFGFNKANHADLERRYGTIAREAYGMTECGCALYMPVEDRHMVGSGSCGIPCPHRETMIADDDGNPVAEGAVGELWLKGPGMMLGYYKRPEANAETFRGEWLRTGDLFRRDAQGYFYIVGRRKDMVRRNAENIAAREVEEVLRGLAEIKEAAVVPVPDPLTGEEVKAYIELQPELTPEDLPPEAVLAFCRTRLASFKIPRYLEYVPAFVMTDSGRVEKKMLTAGRSDLTRNSYDRVDGIWRD